MYLASVLAAANPCTGHYQRHKTVSENLKMPTSLLSRFDVVFLLLDRPEEMHDRNISEHIMNMHQFSKSHNTTNQADTSNSFNKEQEETTSNNINSTPINSTTKTLRQRLKFDCNTILPKQFIPVQILRDYIDYARKYCFPKLTKESAKVLQKLYLTLRSQANIGICYRFIHVCLLLIHMKCA